MSKIELKTRVENELLPFVNRPWRYLGNEYNIVIKDTDAADLKIALCFPDLYETGIRDVSFEILYHFLNSHPSIRAERFYAPWIDAESLMRQQKIPLFSLESKSALSDFALAAFYFPDKLTFANLLTMLSLGGIPLRGEERGAGQPLIIGGGPALNNPEPLSAFLDVVIIGEPGPACWEIAESLMQAAKEQWERPALLQKLAGMPGFYVPSFYQPIYNSFGEFQGIRKTEPSAPDRIQTRPAGKSEQKKYLLMPLVPLADTAHTPHPSGCFARFLEEDGVCAPARLSEPGLPNTMASLHQEIQKFLRSSAGGAVAPLLENDAVFSAACWMALKEKIAPEEQDTRFSFPSAGLSFRLPASGSGAVLEELKASGFTLYPHGGSQRLRSALNINAREQDFLDAVRGVLACGWQTIGLVFTVGLPGEREEDISAIAGLVKKCSEIVAAYPEAQVHVYVRAFSPAARTPLQWEKQESPAVLEQKYALLQENLGETPVKVSWQNPAVAGVETALSRGDRRMAGVMEKAWQNGARFDAFKETFREERWRKAFQDSGMRWDDCFLPISITVVLPWEHIDTGVSSAYLKEEKLRASQAQIHPDNKNVVSIGYGGIGRDQFGMLIERVLAKERGNAGTGVGIGDISQMQVSGGPFSAGPEAMQYGRRERKRQTPVAVIKKRIRIRYSKTGPARFLSQADVVRVLERSARLANIPLVYSQGLRPAPKLSYAFPLGPGIASAAEYLDMEVEIGRETDIQGQFNRFLPPGIQILQYQGIFAKVPALAAIINRSVYEVLLSDAVISGEMLQQWEEQSEAQVKRAGKDGVKELDIRPFVSELRWDKNSLFVTIDSSEGRTAKITEVLESLLIPIGIDYRKYTIQRTGQYIVKDDSILTPFEVL